jgi:hypothetical protein
MSSSKESPLKIVFEGLGPSNTIEPGGVLRGKIVYLNEKDRKVVGVYARFKAYEHSWFSMGVSMSFPL